METLYFVEAFENGRWVGVTQYFYCYGTADSIAERGQRIMAWTSNGQLSLVKVKE